MTFEELQPLVGKRVYTAYGSSLDILAVHPDTGTVSVRVTATNPWTTTVLFEDLFPGKPRPVKEEIT